MGTYEDLSRQQEKKIRQRRECRNAIESIDQDLQRLRKAKTSVSEVKGRVNPLINNARNGFNDLRNWKGAEYDKAKALGTDQIYNDLVKYRNDVDAVLDCICNKITKLENERWKNEGLLGDIARALNNLANEIEKLLN